MSSVKGRGRPEVGLQGPRRDSVWTRPHTSGSTRRDNLPKVSSRETQGPNFFKKGPSRQRQNWIRKKKGILGWHTGVLTWLTHRRRSRDASETLVRSNVNRKIKESLTPEGPQCGRGPSILKILTTHPATVVLVPYGSVQSGGTEGIQVDERWPLN